MAVNEKVDVPVMHGGRDSRFQEETETAGHFASADVRTPSYSGAVGSEDRLFWGFFENSGMCLAILDSQLRVIECNSEFRRQIAPGVRPLIGTRFQEFVEEGDRRRVREELGRLLTGRRVRFTSSLPVVHEGVHRCDCELTCVASQRGAVAGQVLVVARPLTASSGQSVRAGGERTLGELDARILEGVASGASTVHLASKFYLSRQGVEYHIGILLRQFRVPNRAALVAKAYAQGVLHMGIWPPQVTPDCVK